MARTKQTARKTTIITSSDVRRGAAPFSERDVEAALARAVSAYEVGETHLRSGDPFNAAVAFGVAAVRIADPATAWLPRQRGEEALSLLRDRRLGDDAVSRKRAQECADDLRSYAAWQVEECEQKRARRRKDDAAKREEEEKKELAMKMEEGRHACQRGDALLVGLSCLVHFGTSPRAVAEGAPPHEGTCAEAERWRGVAIAAVRAGSW
jgi:hypothetical protein